MVMRPFLYLSFKKIVNYSPKFFSPPRMFTPGAFLKLSTTGTITGLLAPKEPVFTSAEGQAPWGASSCTSAVQAPDH